MATSYQDIITIEPAQRIKGRAVRQMGVLIREIEAQVGGDRKSDEYQSNAADTLITRTEAIASYARQVRDGELLNTAQRIKGRAIRQMGVLIREIEAQVGGDRKSDEYQTEGDHPMISRTQTAREAGFPNTSKKPPPASPTSLKLNSSSSSSSPSRRQSPSWPKPAPIKNPRPSCPPNTWIG